MKILVNVRVIGGFRLKFLFLNSIYQRKYGSTFLGGWLAPDSGTSLNIINSLSCYSLMLKIDAKLPHL